MLQGQSPSEPAAPIHAAHVFLLDLQNNALRPIGKSELVDFQQLAHLPTTDE
ncbi:MAG TPA: hypothetical protein VM282_04225 [Acidimicrobiales bacterium]|nr:hypothetical protein [Acidimicrobiales bacterium]